MAESNALHFLRDNWHILAFIGGVIWYMAQQSHQLKKLVAEFTDFVRETKAERDKLGECVDDHEVRLTVIEDRNDVPRRRRVDGPRS